MQPNKAISSSLNLETFTYTFFGVSSGEIKLSTT